MKVYVKQDTIEEMGLLQKLGVQSNVAYEVVGLTEGKFVICIKGSGEFIDLYPRRCVRADV